MSFSKEKSEKLLGELISDKRVIFHDYNEFTNVEKTNEGGFGTILKAEWKTYGLPVAFKSLKVNSNSNEFINEFVNELQLLRTVSLHPNITFLYGITKDPFDNHILILQFANEGNLREYLKKNFDCLEWTDKYRIAKEITQGLLFLHNNNIIHRDLHSKNILVHDRKMMIADFGLSQTISDMHTTTTNIPGMPAYIDPQWFKNNSYKLDKKSDIYSFGVILWEISSGKPPFQSFTSREAIVIYVFKGQREVPVKGTPHQYSDLYTRCWDEDPDKRPNARSILDTLNKFSPETVNNKIITKNLLNVQLEKFISQQLINYINYNEFTHITEINERNPYKFEWKHFKLTVFLKKLNIGTNVDIQDLAKQLNLIQRASFHPNIVHFYGVTKDSGHLISVLQFANNRTLQEYLNENFNKLQWVDKFHIANEIAWGLAFLHNLNIIHKDLHSKNILIHEKRDEKRAMITGLFKHVIKTPVSNSMADRMTEYIDPQCFKDYTYQRSKASDIYSLGVILWEITSGRKPFYLLKSKEEIAIHIFKGNRERPIKGSPPQYVNLYTSCWDDDPGKRPEIKTIIKILNQLYPRNIHEGNEKPLNKLINKAINDQHINFFNHVEFSGNRLDGYYYEILQFAGKITLRNYLSHNFSKLNWNEKLHMAKEIAEGLEFLHKNNINHCDLHNENILAHEKKMIITGFSLSKQKKMQAYTEPQCFKNPLYKLDNKSDIYSLGIIFWEISSGRPPFDSKYGIPKRILKREKETIIKEVPSQYIELYTKCWDTEPKNRPEIESVLNTLTNIHLT
ncbi:serine/threonine protein kinase [Gigaspora margarita]|uniref:Serine/threonine protein kinase n=1 Tax=Gigaspora margarita TaxID=4874 RepID=A0A8H3XHM7_GIGMA|nr:serine/threonine protein kinase [Gigaspora margarita]